MSKRIAFLRAINVGGHVVKMDALRAIVEQLGVTNVETFIASGNVIFDSSARNERQLEEKIEKALRNALGYEVETFIRTPAELQKVVDARPFGAAETDAHALYVGFLHEAPAAATTKAVEMLATDIDELRIVSRELYWLCRGRSSDSKITNARLERALGMPTTLRNITTVRKLAAKYA